MYIQYIHVIVANLVFYYGLFCSLKEETWIKENIEYTVHIQTYLVLLQFAIDHDRGLFCDVFMHSVSHRVVALLLSLGGTAMVLIVYFLGSLSDDTRHTMQSYCYHNDRSSQCLCLIFTILMQISVCAILKK